MKLYIPRCGQSMTLKEDWTVTLFFEGRNEKFIQFLKPETKKVFARWDYNENQSIQTTIVAGTVLKVDRVYIRNGQNGVFDSLTFSMSAGKGAGRHRFWAKLADVNEMVIEEPTED